MIVICEMVSTGDDKRRFFFTSNYGRHRGRSLSDLSGGEHPRWISTMITLPHEVRPRPECEDGIVDTVEKYIAVYHRDDEQITVEDALREIGASTDFPEPEGCR